MLEIKNTNGKGVGLSQPLPFPMFKHSTFSVTYLSMLKREVLPLKYFSGYCLLYPVFPDYRSVTIITPFTFNMQALRQAWQVCISTAAMIIGFMCVPGMHTVHTSCASSCALELRGYGGLALFMCTVTALWILNAFWKSLFWTSCKMSEISSWLWGSTKTCWICLREFNSSSTSR